LDKHKKKSFIQLNNGMFLLVLIQNEQFSLIMQYNYYQPLARGEIRVFFLKINKYFSSIFLSITWLIGDISDLRTSKII